MGPPTLNWLAWPLLVGMGQDPPVDGLESQSSVFPRYRVVKTNIPDQRNLPS